jgi:hypothetical protein
LLMQQVVVALLVLREFPLVVGQETLQQLEI